VLLGDVPGVDGYEADVDQVQAIAAVHHRVQVRAAAAYGELAAAGVPDRRGPRLGEWIRAELAGHRPAVHAVLPDLDARLAALAACGLPDTLVHGDLHGGNARLGEGPPVIFDWGDSSLGNPAFDVLRLTGHLDATDRDEVVGAWAARWRADAPAADPERAVALVGPLAPLYGAAAYAMFLAHIEPSEHPYHRGDVPDALAAVASLVAAERPTVGG
jgi:aminoglycoside phosphotransferase (APT) family kinase protein